MTDTIVKELAPLGGEPNDFDEMFKAGLHFGRLRRSRNPKAKSYIYGTKERFDIFNLEKTRESFKQVDEFIDKLNLKEEKIILFVGSKPQIKDLVERLASSINMPYSGGRWLGGTLTNFTEIKKRLLRLSDLNEMKETDSWSKYKKKERLILSKELEKMTRLFGGLKNLSKLPDALVVIDPRFESIAIAEAKQLKIPIISLLNSDSNPEDINYPVLANDSSRSSVEYFLNKIIGALGKAKKTEIK